MIPATPPSTRQIGEEDPREPRMSFEIIEQQRRHRALQLERLGLVRTSDDDSPRRQSYLRIMAAYTANPNDPVVLAEMRASNANSGSDRPNRATGGYYNKYLKYSNKLNKYMMGGNLSELYDLDVSKKTIILMGESHTDKKNISEYSNIIKKQKAIINMGVYQFGEKKTYFYSEGPEENRKLLLETDNYSSSVIVQYAITKIPIKLSSVTFCDREGSACDEKYSHDILSIFDENSEINCIIVQIGLIHIPELKRFLNRRPDLKIIIVNTVSKEHLDRLIPEITRLYPSVIDLLSVEQPYKLPEELLEVQKLKKPEFDLLSVEPPKETFIVEILYNTDYQKIYKCPICHSKTGISAPKYPNDTSLFSHKYDCPNKNKIPIEY
jgi:hypothetical protein